MELCQLETGIVKLTKSVGAKHGGASICDCSVHVKLPDAVLDSLSIVSPRE